METVQRNELQNKSKRKEKEKEAKAIPSSDRYRDGFNNT